MHTFRRFLPLAVVSLGLALTGCGGHPTEHRQIAAVHGFTIEGYGIQTEIPTGGSEVKVHATHPGTFKIFCQLHETHQIATFVVQ